MWTEAQQAAIDIKKGSILVSAAAGSGKTAVLVERIIKKITDSKNPIDVDTLLVMTFTRAAAASMKEKIYNALLKEMEKHDNNSKEFKRLKEQSILLSSAKIMTTDSFCLSILKENIVMNILVVDDEQTILTGVEEYLKEYGYSVFTAGNGVEAIEIFEKIEINLIILDLMMPEKNGYEVLEEIRTQSNIPVIILSAMEDEISQLKGFDLEADDYVTKPFNPLELKARVKSHIKKTLR